jgi:hypothetical protein
MKGLFKKINADKIIRLDTYFSFAFLFLHLIYIVILYSFLPPFLPLFNQMPWGEERLGTKIEIFLPFLISISFFSLNLFLALRLYEKMPLISRILSITSLLICILIFIFIVRTIQLII